MTVIVEQDIELLRKDKRVKEVTYEDEIIIIHTNDLRCVSPNGTREAYIGELSISISFTKKFAHSGVYAGYYNFGGRLDIINLTKVKGVWQTPMVFRGPDGETGACWKGYRDALDQAFESKDLLTFIECLFRFCSSYDSNFFHGEAFWDWSVI